jgi:hypothetical protein
MVDQNSQDTRPDPIYDPVTAKAVKHPRERAWSSYRATGGLTAAPLCLRVEEILSHFGQRRDQAGGKYQRYVAEGLNGATIWENLEAQSLLGLEGFADALRGHVTSKQNVREIPKGQRLIDRPSLEKLFEGRGKKKTARDRTIRDAVDQHGYSQIDPSDDAGDEGGISSHCEPE